MSIKEEDSPQGTSLEVWHGTANPGAERAAGYLLLLALSPGQEVSMDAFHGNAVMSVKQCSIAAGTHTA